MKTFSKLFIVILSLMLVLTACSSSNSSSGSSSTKSKSSSKKSTSSKKVTLVWAHGVDQTGSSAKIVKAFNASHPNIQVKERIMPSSSDTQHQQYVTMLNAKSSEVDLMDLDVVWPAEFAQAQYVLPLDRFIQKDNYDLSQYNQGAISAAQFNGKTWALPRFIDVALLFYRKDLVKNPPKTWDQLIQMAEKDKGKGGTKFGYVMQAKQYEGLVCNALEYIASYGGNFVDKNGKVVIDSPAAIKGLSEMVKVVNSDFVPQNITTFTEQESATAFINGQSVFIRNWTYNYALANDKTQSKIVGKVGVAPLPAGDSKSVSTLGGWETAINKYSKHPQQAWEFLKFVAGKQGEKMDAINGGHAPAITSLYNDKDVVKAYPYFGLKGFQDGINKAVSRPVVPNYPKISEIIQTHVSKALAKQETPTQAVKAMSTEMKAAMKQ